MATTAGELAARWVIHTVGPVYSSAEDRTETLRACYRNSLSVARGLGAATVAFPLVSAGAYRWPVDAAIEVAAEQLTAFDHNGIATLVLYSADTLRRAEKIIKG